MKIALTSLMVLSFALLAVQPVSAWAAPNHYEIAEEVYYNLPADVQSKLSLSEMINGADDPDYKFFDYKYHRYPASQDKANYWLEKGRNHYKMGDYKQASYCFGVATHYLADGVCAPHSSNDFTRFQHTKYEVEAMLLTPHITLDKEYGTTNGNQWLKTDDNKHIQQCLDNAATVSYLGVKNAIL